MGAHRIETNVVLAHDAPVTTAPEPYEDRGAELVVTGPLLTLVEPGVGTIVVTTRRFTTFRRTTGRGDAPPAAESEGSRPAVSW
jgi:hypothetical protein